MKTINKIILLAFAIMAFSCEDVLEKDITNDTIQIISPNEGEVVLGDVVNFKWNTLKGADKYRVQVYNENQTVVLDSLVENKLNLACALPTGNYKWRVRGENFAYQSTYSFPVNFSTAVSDVLTDQQVLLSIPSDNSYTKLTSLTLQWQPLTSATSYDIEVVTSGGTTILPTTNVTATSMILNSTNLAQEEKYIWKVKAKNSTTNTETPFAIRNFSVDRTDPNQPQNDLPANNSLTLTANQAITFSWIAIADTGVVQSPISYTIEFSNTNTFSTIIRTAASATTSSSQTFTTTGDYYWRVKATDAAGNSSAFNAPFMFKII